MLKLFVSLPMNGLNETSIKKRMDWCLQNVKSKLGDDVELIYTLIEDRVPSDVRYESVWYLGKSIELLSIADVVFFDHGWERARGCRLEHEIAVKYGLNILNP